jgi:putative ABC transport system permease protein
MRTVRNIWALAVKGLTASITRSLLTILAVAIGIGSVVTLMSMGKGNEQAMLKQLESLGGNSLIVDPLVTEKGSAITLTWEDAEAIQLSVPGVEVAPEARTNVIASHNNETLPCSVSGIDPAFRWVRKVELKEGNFISPDDVESDAMVAVLGSRVADKLFPESQVIGKQIKLDKDYFEIIGVLQSKAGTGIGYEDDAVFVPISTVVRKMINIRTPNGGHSISRLSIAVEDESLIDQKIQEITTFLRGEHRLLPDEDDDFVITSMKEQIKVRSEIAAGNSVFLTAIALISLIVAGVGIMNIMMVSVKERTREIGIYKSIGAGKENILGQFALEACLLTVAGGGVGLLLGTLGLPKLIKGLVSLTSSRATIPPCVFSGDIIIIAMATGFFFGLYPAYKAATLNPVEALRK